jgi:hypothetical protein
MEQRRALRACRNCGAGPSCSWTAKKNEALMVRGQILSQQLRRGICHLPDYQGRKQIRRLVVWMRDVLGGSDHEESFGQDARI